MLRNKYAGKQSSLTLYKSNSQPMKKLINTCKLPSLHGVPNSTPIITDYDMESDNSPRAGRPAKYLGSNSMPISDMKLPTASLLRLDTFRDLSPIIIRELPPLPHVDSQSFPSVFRKKIEACSQICPFADEELERQSIGRKTQHLTDIYRLFIGASPQSNLLLDEYFESIYAMLMKNIVRRLPSLGHVAFANEDVAPLTEPSWPHLSIVYQILLKVLFEFPGAPFFTMKTATKLLRVSPSGDSQERFQISNFLSRYVDLRPEFLDPLLEEFSSIIQSYLDSLSTPFSISTILNAFFSILKDSNEVKPKFTKIFRTLVVPLISDHYFSFFEQTLISIINFFVEDDQRNSSCVVMQIIKKWPFTRLTKQTSFISILMRCLPKMPLRELQPLIPRVFALLADATDSECYKVSETAFSMWTTIGFERIINDNIKSILQIFTPHVLNARNNHWAPSVRSNANFAIAVMMKRDPKILQNISQAPNSEQSEENSPLKTWVSIARSASKVDVSINLSKKLNEISATYTLQASAKKIISLAGKATRARSNSMRAEPIFKPIIQFPVNVI